MQCSGSVMIEVDCLFQIELGTMGDSEECKLVLVARTDLQMGKGKIAAQVAFTF